MMPVGSGLPTPGHKSWIPYNSCKSKVTPSCVLKPILATLKNIPQFENHKFKRCLLYFWKVVFERHFVFCIKNVVFLMRFWVIWKVSLDPQTKIFWKEWVKVSHIRFSGSYFILYFWFKFLSIVYQLWYYIEKIFFSVLSIITN